MIPRLGGVIRIGGVYGFSLMPVSYLGSIANWTFESSGAHYQFWVHMTA